MYFMAHLQLLCEPVLPVEAGIGLGCKLNALQANEDSDCIGEGSNDICSKEDKNSLFSIKKNMKVHRSEHVLVTYLAALNILLSM